MQTLSRETSLISNQRLYQLTGKSAWFSWFRVLKQKLNIFKVGKLWYEPTITMFHGSNSQVPPPLTLSSNMDLLVGNLPVMHHSLPKTREEVRVTMLLWNASQKGYQWICLAVVKKNFLAGSWHFVWKAALFIRLDRHLTFHCKFWMLRCWYGWQHVSVFTLEVITVML